MPQRGPTPLCMWHQSQSTRQRMRPLTLQQLCPPMLRQCRPPPPSSQLTLHQPPPTTTNQAALPTTLAIILQVAHTITTHHHPITALIHHQSMLLRPATTNPQLYLCSTMVRLAHPTVIACPVAAKHKVMVGKSVKLRQSAIPFLPLLPPHL